jgi:hypothetical protein
MRKTSSLPHYEVWRTVSLILEMCPFSTSSNAPEREGKGGFTWVVFPLFSLNYFEWSDVIAADINLGLNGPVLGLGLNWWPNTINLCLLVAVDHWA